MAINKQLSSHFGVDAIYHNIGAYQIDYRRRTLDVQIFGYASRDAKESGAEPLLVSQAHFSGESFDFGDADITRKEIYDRLIKQDAWLDGIAE